ncbi:uncharacterized protein N7483_009765 [Penicillium malachiteum]|uniref:uncharacterized protein n=1 Tax=Penicillium malachiteum TaxID=1324776 RepID=UPI00254907BF|nr:uncharacterized protein N7483_009765 [Penicillium malachiteum]KAJ5721831.1 hypothetical protein N7483_009765 [Penicillium malachiteum]
MSSSTRKQDPPPSDSDHEDSSKSSDQTSSDQTNYTGAVTPKTSGSSSRAPTPGTSRRNMTNEEFLVNAFKALDPNKVTSKLNTLFMAFSNFLQSGNTQNPKRKSKVYTSNSHVLRTLTLSSRADKLCCILANEGFSSPRPNHG